MQDTREYTNGFFKLICYHLQYVLSNTNSYSEWDRMVRELALTRAKLISLHKSDLGRPCLVNIINMCIFIIVWRKHEQEYKMQQNTLIRINALNNECYY